MTQDSRDGHSNVWVFTFPLNYRCVMAEGLVSNVLPVRIFQFFPQSALSCEQMGELAGPEAVPARAAQLSPCAVVRASCCMPVHMHKRTEGRRPPRGTQMSRLQGPRQRCHVQ